MKNLIIGYDGKRAALGNTGLGNYSRLVVEVLADRRPDCRFRLYTPRLNGNERLARLLDGRPQITTELPDTAFGRRMGAVWRSSCLTRQLMRDHVSLYHGLSNELPVGIDRCGISSVVTIHDLIFERHPEFYHRADVLICRAKFRYAARKADRVIAISRRTADDLTELYGIDPDKIDIVYQGCDSSFYRPISDDDRRRVADTYRLPQRYIICVGTIERRKNALLAVEALRQLPDDLCLALVGRESSAYTAELRRYAAANGLTGRVRFLAGVPMADLPPLYNGAVCAAYPSRYEGFGIPVIEAIASGTPVVAATGSCLEEAGGPGAVYVNPDSADEFAARVTEIMTDNGMHSRMVADGREYIRRFSADEFARGLENCYQKVLNRK